MKKILFIFDRVMHYHKELFQRLEGDLPGFGCELHVLSGAANAGSHRARRVGPAVGSERSKVPFPRVLGRQLCLAQSFRSSSRSAGVAARHRGLYGTRG